MLLVEKWLRRKFDPGLELAADGHYSVFIVRVCCPDSYFVSFLANLHARSADLKSRFYSLTGLNKTYVFAGIVERLANKAKKSLQPNSV